MDRRPRGTHLADELIEALRVELLAHGADPRLPRLPLLQLCVCVCVRCGPEKRRSPRDCQPPEVLLQVFTSTQRGFHSNKG